MIGEIRDEETAEIAMRMAITGHLVLSTLHTNDACGAVNRLVDLGLEPFFVADALTGVISQRLVRRLCPECKKPHITTKEEMNILHLKKNVKYSNQLVVLPVIIQDTKDDLVSMKY